MELERNQSNCGLYPLCITMKEQNFRCSNNSEISFDQDTFMVEVETASVTALTDNLSVNVLCVLNSNSDYVICNRSHKVIKIKQLYKDKSTIVAVMQKYVIDNRFKIQGFKIREEEVSHICYFFGYNMCTFLCIIEA